MNRQQKYVPSTIKQEKICTNVIVTQCLRVQVTYNVHGKAWDERRKKKKARTTTEVRVSGNHSSGPMNSTM